MLVFEDNQDTYTTLDAIFNALKHKGSAMLGFIAFLNYNDKPKEPQIEHIKSLLTEIRKILDMMELEIDTNL